MPLAEIAGFHLPGTVGDALRLKQDLGTEAVYLAGGTWVNHSGFDRRAGHVISLAGLSRLRGMEETASGILIGAMTTFQELLEATLTPPELKEALARVCNRNIRNQATLGGAIGAARRAADVLPALVAMEAEAVVESLGSTAQVAVGDLGAAEPDGLITGIAIPRLAGRALASGHLALTTGSLPIVSVAVSAGRRGGLLERPIVALAGAACDLVRVSALERALDGDLLPPVAALEALVRGHVSLEDDDEGSGEYKRRVAGVLIARAFRDVCDGAGGK